MENHSNIIRRILVDKYDTLRCGKVPLFSEECLPTNQKT